MPRMRAIKPGFFVNELLAALSPQARLLFIGLWCHADREGRLEDRPRRLRVQIFPYEDLDIDQLLRELEQAGFILRYESGGRTVVQVVNFAKHQRPHQKEPASTLPPSPGPQQDQDRPGPSTNPAADDLDKSHSGTHPAAENPGRSCASPDSPPPGPLGMENGNGVLEPDRGAGEGITAPSGRSVDEVVGGKRRGRPRAELHPEAPTLATYLAQRARAWKPSVRVDGSSRRSLRGMDGLLRIDKRDPTRVRALIAWLFDGSYEPNGEFDWRVNVLSGDALRRQWDRLENLYDRASDASTAEWTGR